MDESELVPVISVKNINQAELIRTALRSEGIRSWLEDAGQAGLSGILDITVMVKPEDEDAARKFLKEHHAS